MKSISISTLRHVVRVFSNSRIDKNQDSCKSALCIILSPSTKSQYVAIRFIMSGKTKLKNKMPGDANCLSKSDLCCEGACE